MKPVMLATDGSPTADKATRTAVELAQQLGTELVIVSVWDVPYVGYGTMGFTHVPVNADFSKLGEADAAGAITAAAAVADEAGVGARTTVLRGFPVEAICTAADKFAPQFLVVGSHGWGAVKRALFGSVSTGVLHHANCPVLVVRGDPVEDDFARNGSREPAHACRDDSDVVGRWPTAAKGTSVRSR
jgi:nucleotide-binding universal stress UspA family protein